MGISNFTVRWAAPADIPRILWIDAECATLPGSLLMPAPPGELESGVLAGDVLVAESQHTVAGYLHLDQQYPHAVYVAGVAVLPGMRRRGMGAALLAAALGSADPELPVYTVTSPRNLVTLTMFFAQGFVGTWAFPNLFGPQEHRLGMRLLPSGETLPSVRRWHRATEFTRWSGLLDRGYAAVRVAISRGVPVLGLAGYPSTDSSPCLHRFQQPARISPPYAG
ncbi:N-acetyltransferase [Pseudonocardiaceae bacterium YIM PH 21723]|nr:N-acetyltransferase [Pseudonocardiaceae bacterium YIM PH 21723]